MAELVYPPVIRAALGLFRALDLKLDIRGKDNVPATGGAVVVMNHVSYLDFALAGVPMWQAKRRLVRFMAKEAVFRHPVAGPLMRGMHHIPVDRAAGADAYRHAVAALRDGQLVGVFPETTISRSFCLMAFKTGAARMAREAAVPALPVVLWGSQRILTKGRPRNLRAARHTPVSITVGEPIGAAELTDTVAGTHLLAEVMGRILAESQSRYPAPDPGEPAWWLPAHLGGSAPTPDDVAEQDASGPDVST